MTDQRQPEIYTNSNSVTINYSRGWPPVRFTPSYKARMGPTTYNGVQCYVFWSRLEQTFLMQPG